MNVEEDDIDCVDASALIQDLLGFEEDALAAMAPPQCKHNNHFALLGLQEFMRRVFLRVAQLRDDDTEVMSVMSESPVSEWPDERTARLANLMISARVNEWRPYRRLPFLVLEPTAAAKLPPVSREMATMSMGEVMSQLRGLPVAQDPRREFAMRYPLSIKASIEDLFHIDARDLAARFIHRRNLIAEAFAKNPEHQAQLGLAYLIGDAIHQYKVMVRRNIEGIRLMGEEDAKIAKRPNARMANTITLLSAAIRADDQHVISFEPPKAPPANEEEVLWAAARLVNADYSLEAVYALELLCDRNVHFGSSNQLSRASELLLAVGG